MKEKVGDLFQQETKYIRGQIKGGNVIWQKKPNLYKTYPESKCISLPQPEINGGPALWETIKKRRSVRDFKDSQMTKEQLSQLLWSCQGITVTIGNYGLRAAPSAGALYPIETYLVINSVSEIDQGIYHYNVERHELELLKQGDFGQAAAHAALDQSMVGQANVTFIWTAIFERTRWKYAQRAYRYIYLDSGHIAAQLSLAATGMGLGTCQIAALYDDEVNALIDVDGIEESVIYMTAVGNSLAG